MKYSTITIIIFSFLALPFYSTHAIMALELVTNDNQKECRTYQPYGNTSLPDGWEYHDYEKSNYISTHQSECERIGYTYNPKMLKGITNPAYLAIVYSFHGIALLAVISLLIAYLKTKKKKILIAIPIVIVVYLMLYGIFTFNIG